MTGHLGLTGNPLLSVPSGTAHNGYVLTCDSSGNITLAPATGGGGSVGPDRDRAEDGRLPGGGR